MHLPLKLLRVALFACTLSIPGSVIAAGDYPAKTVRIVVPFPAGGSTDLVARKLAQGLRDLWQQPVVVENRPGRAGTVGSSYVSKAAPDGYTLLIGSNGTHATANNLFKVPPYDPVLDFTAITELISTPTAIMVHPSVPAKTLKELVAYAKSRPGQVSFGSNGIGSPNHLATELLEKMAGIDLNHVPFNGSGPAMNALLGGHVLIMNDVLMTSLQSIKSGNLNVIAVTSLQRSHVLPDVPTVAESGFPGFEAVTWLGFWGPPNMSPETLAKIHRDVVAVLNAASMKEFLRSQGFDLIGSAPEQFTKRIKEENLKWRQVIAAAGGPLE